MKKLFPTLFKHSFATFVLALIITSFSITFNHTASAVTASDWKAGRIIDDGLFTNGRDMSVGDIQHFLNTKVPNCDTSGQQTSEFGGPDLNGDGRTTRAEYAQSRGYSTTFTCLKDYYEVPKTEPNSNPPISNYGGAPRPTGSVSAAQLIWDAAQRSSINPKVLLVKIATESAGPLTSDDWPLKKQYDYAMGAHCPDSGPGGSANCDPAYAGFSIQMYEAASLMRWYIDSMDKPWWQYKKPYQNNEILWNVVERGCGGSNVYIETKATAALYTYTPYQPNSAALNNMYGEGDNCSAYGNRNFWRVFNDWFGTSSVNGRVYIDQYDNVTDADGESATFGFRLNMRPSHPVTVLINISKPESIGIVGGTDRVVISPDSWDKADQNIVTLYGKNDGSNTSTAATITTTEVSSYDPQFDLLTGIDVGDPMVLNQGGARAITRLYSSALNKHVYSSRAEEISMLVNQGYVNEGAPFNACEAGDQNIARLKKGTTSIMLISNSSEYSSALGAGYTTDGPIFSVSLNATTTVYRLRNNSENYFYTTSSAERDSAVASHGYTYEGVAFKACLPTDKPVFRMINRQTTNHFYTASSNERDSAGASGYRSEGIAFYIKPAESNYTQVTRLYNSASRSHFYTIDQNEINAAVSSGYRQEGVAFSIPSSSIDSAPVYRLYNATKRAHFYTAMGSERSVAASYGYSYEGIGFNAR